ncbi:MAG: glycosyltransferase family A protein [Sulfitobacter sp.]
MTQTMDAERFGPELSLSDQVKRLSQSKFVHKQWYLDRYPDVQMVGLEPAEHYLKYGAMMGRNPGKSFDTAFYLKTYPDVRESGLNPLMHFLDFGRAEGRLPHPGAVLKTTDCQDVRRLQHMLWAGLGAHAAPMLGAIIGDPKRDERARFIAACQLAAWFDFKDNRDEARRLLDLIGGMSREFARSAGRLMRLALLHTGAGQLAQARGALQQIDAKEISNDTTLAYANLEVGQGKLDVINAIFTRNSLANVRWKDPDQPLTLYNLAADPVSSVLRDVGKVSVVMPAYNAAGFIESAVRSLLSQSYRNIEILVVDDCSPDGTFEVVQAMARADPRIIALQQGENAGAYPARNLGLKHATGDYLTTHDADDWSHPQKIELQLAALQSDPHAVAALAHWARVRRSLEFTTNWRLADKIIHSSHSSFMFRRRVFDRLGGWDNVRVSADSEFIWRVGSVFGDDAIVRVLPDVPLAFALDDDGSLTRSKVTHLSTTNFGLRHYYREICRYWHRQHPGGLSDENTTLKLAMLPREMQTRDQARPEVDILICGDCGDPRVIAKIHAVLESGGALRYGVSHVPDATRDVARDFHAQQLDDGFIELLKRPDVGIILDPGQVLAGQTLSF